MGYDDFSRLLSSFRTELTLWPPSQQDFATSLTKAKMNASLRNIRLTDSDRNELREMYSEARKEEHLKKEKS